jgi:hypothetical protein
MLPEPEDEEAKAKFKKNEVKAKRILADSIKDHLIANVSELKTPNEMFVLKYCNCNEYSTNY